MMITKQTLAVSNIQHAKKVRSMLLLQKALREEAYESCASLIDCTLKNGATKREIAWILKNPSWHVEEPSLN